MTPVYSIIIPTLNSGGVIGACLESIACQSFQDLEVLISDGGSTDGTVEYARQLLFKQGMLASIIESQGSSVYGAINQASERAKGEWLYILGSDDRLYDDRVLERISHHLKTTEAVAVYGNVWRERCEGHVHGGYFWLNRLNVLNICHQAIFYRAKPIKTLNLVYDERYRFLADWDFNLKLWSRARFEYLPIIVAHYTAGGLSDREKDNLFLDDLQGKIIDYFGWRAFWLLTPAWLSIAVSLRPSASRRIFLMINRLVYAVGRSLFGRSFGVSEANASRPFIEPPSAS